MGNNDLDGLLNAVSRYNMGGADYVDPVAFENVFKIEDGSPKINFEPVIRVRRLYGSAHDDSNRPEPRTCALWPNTQPQERFVRGSIVPRTNQDQVEGVNVL